MPRDRSGTINWLLRRYQEMGRDLPKLRESVKGDQFALGLLRELEQFGRFRQNEPENIVRPAPTPPRTAPPAISQNAGTPQGIRPSGPALVALYETI